MKCMRKSGTEGVEVKADWTAVERSSMLNYGTIDCSSMGCVVAWGVFVAPYAKFGLGTTLSSPLASGFLTGKHNEVDLGDTRISMPMYSWLRQQFESDEVRNSLTKVKELAKVAGDLGVTLPKLALAWCLKNPNVSTVLTGASKPEQVRENMKAGEVVEQLDDGVMKRIESILQGA